MARYIDLDKAIKRLNASPAFPNMGMDGYFLLGVVEDLLKKLPTADVAPKSEVAREIFAEIDKIRIIEKSCQRVNVYYDTGREYEELKKKYTEEKE